MAKRKTIFEGARDIFEQGLQSVKNLAKFLASTSRDKRTIKTTQKAWEQLSEGRSNKDIGTQLGIPYQRVSVLKKKIEAGEAYSPELRDVLREEAGKYNEEPQELDSGIYYFPNKEKLKNSVNHLDVIKTFPELSDAQNFHNTIIQSNQFIGIARIRKGKHNFYQVVGFGRRSQRPRNGKISDTRAHNRIDQILHKYGYK